MAPVPPKVLTKVDTTTADLVKYNAMSEDLVAAYVKLVGVPEPVVTPINCTARGDVNKVFSHSIRAFLECIGLDYNAADPDAPGDLYDKDFTRAKPVSDNDLLRYEDLSKHVVEEYTRIIGVSNARTVDCPCTDVDNVKKVFSHSARAFLKWEGNGLKYTTEEPVNPSA